jgi:hypothetical protein
VIIARLFGGSGRLGLGLGVGGAIVTSAESGRWCVPSGEEIDEQSADLVAG